MSWKHPNATSLSDHSRANFKGATYVVREQENGAYEIERKDRGGRIELIEGEDKEKNLREARTRAQVMAKRNSNTNKEALVRIKPTGEVLGFGGKYEEQKRTPTPESDLEELEDIGLRADEPVGKCIRKERKSGRPQDQAVAICLSKRDRGELEDHELEFHDEDALEPNPDIDLNEDVEETLRELVEEHNSEVEKESRKATIGQLKSVYSRGRGAFTQTSRPGVDSATQWALARTKNAYLPLLKTGEPPNEDYVQDNDLLPEGHPKSTRGEMSDTQATLGKDEEDEEEEDAQDMIDTRQKTGTSDRDKKKGELEKKAETLEPFTNEQSGMDEFTQELEWERDRYGNEGDEGSFGETSEIVKSWYNPEHGTIELIERNNPRTKFNWAVGIQNPPKISSIRNYKNKSGAQRRVEKRKNLETDLTGRTSGFSDVEMRTEDMVKLTNAEQVFNQYQEDTELTITQLGTWLNDPCRKRASGDDHDKHIERAMFLISKIDSPEDAVTTEVPDRLAMERAERRVPDELEGEVSGNLAVFQMQYASSFISRHKAMIDNPESISTETEECPSISESALRNWGGSHFSNPTI